MSPNSILLLKTDLASSLYAYKPTRQRATHLNISRDLFSPVVKNYDG